MNPDDFLTLAMKLSASAGEVERRSAVSRAYYGVFHLARLRLESCGLTCPESAEAHDKISKCLQHAGDNDLAAAGSKLHSLRTARNHADYRLSDPRFADAKFIAVQLAIAREIFDSLKMASRGNDEARLAMRRYARDILKLTIRGDD